MKIRVCQFNFIPSTYSENSGKNVYFSFGWEFDENDFLKEQIRLPFPEAERIVFRAYENNTKLIYFYFSQKLYKSILLSSE